MLIFDPKWASSVERTSRFGVSRMKSSSTSSPRKGAARRSARSEGRGLILRSETDMQRAQLPSLGHWGQRLLAAGAIVFATACGGSEDAKESDSAMAQPRYVLPGVRFDADYNSTPYVNLLESIDTERVDWGSAREFPGFADVWVHEGSLFVSQEEDFTITKYAVEGRDLVELGRLGFSDYGPSDFGFWRNVFVGSNKAYLLNGNAEYVVWNPHSMEITGTIGLPELPDRGELTAFPGYSDRAARVRDGRLYQPMYWTDESYFRFAPDSRIVVVDVDSDEVVDVLEVPCPGLDFATTDSKGNLFFSSWVFAPGGAALLGQADTCVVELGAGESSPSLAFQVPDVVDGYQGGAMRHLGDDIFLLSVLHDDHAPAEAGSDPQVVANGNNWRFWSYDASSGEAALVDSLDWNSGGAYSATVDGRQLLLVPSSDYSKTTAYDIGRAGPPQRVFESQGWSVRLFELE